MSNKILCLLTAASLSLIAVAAHAQASNFDPSRAAGNQRDPKISGNDQNRKAVEGVNILGGGPRKVNANSAATSVFGAGATTSSQAAYQKSEAEKAYKAGLGFMRTGNLTQAETQMKIALAIRETHFANSDPNIPEVKEKLAEIYALQKRKREALEMYSSALASYARFNGPGTNHRIRPLTGMGTIHLSESNYKGALDCYNQAYMLTQRDKGLSSPEAMRLRMQLASVNQAAKSYDLAASIYNECFDLQKKNEKLIDKEQLIPALKNYVFVLKELKRDDEAATIAARVTALTGGTPVANETPDAKPAEEKTESVDPSSASNPATESKPATATTVEATADPAK